MLSGDFYFRFLANKRNALLQSMPSWAEIQPQYLPQAFFDSRLSVNGETVTEKCVKIVLELGFIHEDLCNGFCCCLVLGHHQPKQVALQQEEAGHHGDLSPRKGDHRQSYHPACAVEHLHQLVSFRVVSEVQSGCEPFADVSFFP